MSDRYFVDTPITASTAQLRGPEAHHLAHVMRAAAGTPVILFDGSGAEFSAHVLKVGRAEIELAIESRSVVDRESASRITLAVALPKGDRQRWLVEKGVELGVARLLPLVTERSNPSDRSSAEKLHRAVIEASKQCGRNRLMEIERPCAMAGVLTAEQPGVPRFIAHPGGDDFDKTIDKVLAGDELPPEIVLAVGPEGGFTADEIALALAHGWQNIGLGRRVLRVETAAIAIVTATMLRLEANG